MDKCNHQKNRLAPDLEEKFNVHLCFDCFMEKLHGNEPYILIECERCGNWEEISAQDPYATNQFIYNNEYDEEEGVFFCRLCGQKDIKGQPFHSDTKENGWVHEDMPGIK